MFEEYEGAPGAIELQLELMNPISQLEIVTDPSLENLIRAAYMPGIGIAGYALVAKLTGEAVVVVTASAVAQREVWQNIGDEQTGAIHFAGAGGMSGGSMPVVTSQDTSSPTGGFTWESIMSLF
jgi:hypothetical protein